MQGTTITLKGSSSSGLTSSAGLMIVGVKTTAVPFLDGILLASLDILVGVSVPKAGFALPVKVPTDSSVCGLSVYVQLLQKDTAASKGVSFTRGMRLTIGK